MEVSLLKQVKVDEFDLREKWMQRGVSITVAVNVIAVIMLVIQVHACSPLHLLIIADRVSGKFPDDLIAMPDQPAARPSSLGRSILRSYDALGRKIIAIHRWAADQGLRGGGIDVFEGLCRRLGDAGVPLWRSFAGVQTLRPQ